MRTSHHAGIACAAGVLWCLSGAARAAGTARFAEPSAAATADPAALGGGTMQVLLSLAIVIAAIVLLGWLARRLRVMPRGRTGALRVVDEIALGAKERAVILEVDGARLVLGVGEGRVALLHHATAATAVAAADTAPADTAPATAGAPRFAELLTKALGR
jgi:flagellar protein FliO/FliZ